MKQGGNGLLQAQTIWAQSTHFNTRGANLILRLKLLATELFAGGKSCQSQAERKTLYTSTICTCIWYSKPPSYWKNNATLPPDLARIFLKHKDELLIKPWGGSGGGGAPCTLPSLLASSLLLLLPLELADWLPLLSLPLSLPLEWSGLGSWSR